MSTAVEPNPSGIEAPHDATDVEGGHSDAVYIKVAIILALMTALEVSLSYLHIGSIATILLIVLMVLKFVTVALYFMHLKYDAKIFGRLFYTGLILAVLVYSAALASFQLFSR